MRSAKRIYDFCNLLVIYWMHHQDYRFIQIVNALLADAIEAGLIHKVDPFFIEDDDWISALKVLNQRYDKNNGSRPVTAFFD